MIVKVDDTKRMATIYSDLTSRQIQVSLNDITETSEVSTGRDVFGNYALYELVALSRDVVGVIVEIQNGIFKILDNKGTLQTCNLQDITRHSKDRTAVALDVDNQQIRISDVIIPQLDPFKGQNATVKHIYRAVLFCHTKVCTTNAGMFVIRARLVKLAGTSRKRVQNPNMISANGGTNDTQNDQKLRQLNRYKLRTKTVCLFFFTFWDCFWTYKKQSKIVVF